jgi:hypothetical protein
VVDTTFVQVFISFDLIAVLISDPDQEQPSLTTIDCDLADYLVETLVEQLFSSRTESKLPGLFQNEPFV